MAAFQHTDIHDAGLNHITANTTVLYICSAQPATYAEATSTYALGSKTTPTFTGPLAGDVSGRKITVDAIADGLVSADGLAAYYALVSGTKLLIADGLNTSQQVTNGNPFSLTAFDIEWPNPA